MEENEFETGSESNYSEKGTSEDQSDDDTSDTSDDKSADPSGDDDDQEEIVVDLHISPAGTWENARNIKKAQWIKDRKWRCYMEQVLVDRPSKDWTMKRFLDRLCVRRRVRGYRKVRSG